MLLEFSEKGSLTCCLFNVADLQFLRKLLCKRGSSIKRRITTVQFVQQCESSRRDSSRNRRIIIPGKEINVLLIFPHHLHKLLLPLQGEEVLTYKMGGSFLEPEVFTGGRIGTEHVEGVELGPEFPLVLPVHIGLPVGHDAGDSLAGGGLFDPGLPAVQDEAVLPAIRATESKNPASGGLSPEKVRSSA